MFYCIFSIDYFILFLVYIYFKITFIYVHILK